MKKQIYDEKNRNGLYVAWRLLFAGSGFKRRKTDIWKIWNVAKTVPEENTDQQGISICY